MDEAITSGMQGARAGSGMLHRAGRTHLGSAASSDVTPLAHSGGVL